MSSNKMIKKAFFVEFEKATFFYKAKKFQLAFEHLERAHILGQKFPLLHTKTHIWMLRIGLATKDFKEVVGQLIRIPSGFIGSALGIFPKGNTGGSNVSAIKSMPIPKDLNKYFD